MSYRKNLLLAALLAAIPATALAQTPDDWNFSLRADYLYGDVDGYIQTPAGGEPGTTSPRRPKLSEIGIDSTSIYDAEITAARDADELYVGGQWIRMSGSSTLDEALISHGETFPAGAHVSADVDLDWYRVGYRRRFTLARDWTIGPSAGLAILDFNYRLHSDATTANRGYIKLNAQFGLDTEWRPRAGRFSLNLRLLGSLPISPPLPQMHVEELVATYRVLENERSNLQVEAGVAFEQINFEDNQDVPNKINADFGPMWIVGLKWRF